MQALFLLLSLFLNVKITPKKVDNSFYFCLVSIISFFYEVLVERSSAIKTYSWSVVVCKVLYRKSN